MSNFDDLFAQRLLLEDDGFDEYEIIKKLGYIIEENNYAPTNEIGIYIKNFYEHFNYDITLEQINNALEGNNDEAEQPPQLILPLFTDNIIFSNNSSSELSNSIFQSFINIVSEINNLPLNISVHQVAPNMSQENVVKTLDSSEKNKLVKYKLENDSNDKCTVCMSTMDKDEEICKLPCEHLFHSECIDGWLQKYNYICPVCRKEVGKPKYHI